MIRPDDWPERLAAYVNSKRGVPFAWGTNDCASFAADAIVAMGGERPDIPTFVDAADYATFIEEHDTMTEVSLRLGPPISPLSAQRGDIVLVEGGHGPTLGVCIGEMAACPGEDGMVTKPMSGALAAWSV